MLTSTLLEMCEMTNLQPGKQITILGAGIAGLVAAYELERLGHEVNIIEGNPRIGGRIWTHRFDREQNAPYAELGAMCIPSSHHHTLHYVNEMGLSDKLRKFITAFEEQNAFIYLEGKIFKMKDAPQIFQQGDRGIFTDTRYSENTRLFAAWLKTIVDTISPGDLGESLENDLKSHLMDELERLDLAPYFGEENESIDLQSFIKENPGFRARCSKALDMLFEDIVVETSRDLLQIQGGMEQIIHRLAESIKSPIKCNQKVVAIRVDSELTEIDYVENGEKNTRRCDYVLSTIPFSVLRKIELEGLDERKLNCIHNTYYSPATRVDFHTKEAFWHFQGIRGEGVCQTYYKDMLVEAASIAWGDREVRAGGCNIDWDRLAVNTSNYLEAARRQHKLFFAGEHCSKYPACLQGSIESALEAVYDIVSDKRVNSLTTINSFIQRENAFALQKT